MALPTPASLMENTCESFQITPPHTHTRSHSYHSAVPCYGWMYNWCLKWVGILWLLRMEINTACYNEADLRLTARLARTNPWKVLKTIRTPFGHLSLKVLSGIQHAVLSQILPHWHKIKQIIYYQVEHNILDNIFTISSHEISSDPINQHTESLYSSFSRSRSMSICYPYC